MVRNIKHHVLIRHLLLLLDPTSIWVLVRGGNKIPTILNEVIVDYLRGNGTLQESINKPRFIMMVEQSSMKMLWMIMMLIFSKV